MDAQSEPRVRVRDRGEIGPLQHKIVRVFALAVVDAGNDRGYRAGNLRECGAG